MLRKRRASKLLIEPPTVATGDIAFNLVVFFLVCASSQPDSGRRQEIPKSEAKQQQQEQSQTIDVELLRGVVRVNGDPVKLPELEQRIRTLLRDKRREQDRVVAVRSAKDTPYQQWITATSIIERAGGIVTLQIQEEKTTLVQ